MLHSKGTGKCACSPTLTECPSCGKRSLHKVAGDYICENGCSKDERLQAAWKAEMKAAVAKVR